jgi:hypothetical protein
MDLHVGRKTLGFVQAEKAARSEMASMPAERYTSTSFASRKVSMRSSRHRSAVLLFTFLLTAFSVAQEPTKPSSRHVEVASMTARPEDVSTLDGVMKAYYDVISGPAGQPRQWARDRTLYTPEVSFVIISDDADGTPVAKQLTHQEFVDDSDAEVVKGGFYEKEIHRIVHRYDNWANVVSTSQSRRTPDGPVIGHSIDNLDLFWDGHRWWIMHVTIAEIRPDHPLPQEFQP